MIKVAPSILAADFSNLGRAVADAEGWGADYIHFDVMDGSFVPAITFGPEMCRALRPHTRLPLDVHLMVEHPETHIEQFAAAGADIISIHIEADRHAHRTLQRIRRLGVRGGIALNPSTPVCAVEYVLTECDMVQLMSVNPGAGGQEFIPATLRKIAGLRALEQKLGLSFDIEVDGGINEATARLCREAGANVLVAGSSIFGAEDPAAAIGRIRGFGEA